MGVGVGSGKGSDNQCHRPVTDRASESVSVYFCLLPQPGFDFGGDGVGERGGQTPSTGLRHPSFNHCRI